MVPTIRHSYTKIKCVPTPWASQQCTIYFSFSVAGTRRRPTKRNRKRNEEQVNSISAMWSSCGIDMRRPAGSGRPVQSNGWDLLICSFVRRKPYIFDEIILQFRKRIEAEGDLYGRVFGIQFQPCDFDKYLKMEIVDAGLSNSIFFMFFCYFFPIKIPMVERMNMLGQWAKNTNLFRIIEIILQTVYDFFFQRNDTKSRLTAINRALILLTAKIVHTGCRKRQFSRKVQTNKIYDFFDCFRLWWMHLYIVTWMH